MCIRNVSSASPLSSVWNFFIWDDPNDFMSRLVTMDKTCLYHYDLETKHQSVEWWHSSLLCPKKILSAKICQKSSHLNFWDGLRQHPPHWLSSSGPNYQRGVSFIPAGAVEGHFEGKMLWQGHQRCLVLG
jgi:hypothetical protein